MYLAEKATKIHDINGNLPTSLDDVPFELEDYLAGNNYKH
jgi:hypothetical protein